MDIFTTQLTRVVPVPIKQANLKVKALLKEAPNSKLTKDPNHLENHEYYFTAEDEYHAHKRKNEQDIQDEKSEELPVEVIATDVIDEKSDVDKPLTDKANSKDDDTKHLDLYA